MSHGRIQIWAVACLSIASLFTVPVTVWADNTAVQGMRTITGEVLRITGTFAVVKGPSGKGVLEVASDTVLVQDDAGQQVALRVGKDTKQDGVIDAGDKIEASVGPDGKIISIRSKTAQGQ
jgi:hypothetical protein